MRKPLKQALSVVLAVALVATAMGGAVQMGMVDRGQVDPTGEAQALACGGLCIAGVAGAAAIAGGAIHAEYFAGDKINETELQVVDAQETEKNVYQGGVTQAQNNRILTDSLSNYLNDTESTALMVGKNAYIRTLNNGTAEAQAREQAKAAVSDYYSVKQKQLLAQWETSTAYTSSLRESLETHAEANESLVYVDYSDMTDSNAQLNESATHFEAQTTATLENGTTVTYQTASVRWSVVNSGGTTETYQRPMAITYEGLDTSGDILTSPDTEIKDYQGGGIVYNSGGERVRFHGLNVAPPTEDYNTEAYLRYWEFNKMWKEIDSQNSEIHNRLDTFITNTYSEYQTGEINNSDLIDPYLGTREYGPESSYGSFTLRSLVSMGMQPPANMSGVGEMTIQNFETGETMTGILMSDGTPEGGEFRLNTTYDAATLQGQQFVVNTDDGTSSELTGQFEIKKVRKPDGSTLNSDTIAYETVDYQTTDTAEYKQLTEQLKNYTVALESRQQALRSGGGGGLLDGVGGSLGLGLNNTQVAGVLALLAFLALALLAVLS